MRFKLDRASLIIGGKFTVFALFYVVFEGNFPSTSRCGAYIWRGNLTEGFLRYPFGGLIFEGAYFRNFTVISLTQRVLDKQIYCFPYGWDQMIKNYICFIILDSKLHNISLFVLKLINYSCGDDPISLHQLLQVHVCILIPNEHTDQDTFD